MALWAVIVEEVIGICVNFPESHGLNGFAVV
jgi:hypothetical protein